MSTLSLVLAAVVSLVFVAAVLLLIWLHTIPDRPLRELVSPRPHGRLARLVWDIDQRIGRIVLWWWRRQERRKRNGR